MAFIKTKEEIQHIKKSCKLTVKLFKKLFKNLKNHKFKTERDICLYLLTETKKMGLKPAFKPIVASSESAVEPHHKPLSELKSGFLVIDYGLRYKGYCADMTRTFYLGKPSKKHVNLYNKVLNVQKECLNMSKEDKMCQNLHNFAKSKLKYLIHGLGHGVGKKIHEYPRINSKSNAILKKNMVITIEPGYYNPKSKVGIRIEDTILIRKDKPLILTNFTKKLLIIENY